MVWSWIHPEARVVRDTILSSLFLFPLYVPRWGSCSLSRRSQLSSAFPFWFSAPAKNLLSRKIRSNDPSECLDLKNIDPCPLAAKGVLVRWFILQLTCNQRKQIKSDSLIFHFMYPNPHGCLILEQLLFCLVQILRCICGVVRCSQMASVVTLSCVEF